MVLHVVDYECENCGELLLDEWKHRNSEKIVVCPECGEQMTERVQLMGYRLDHTIH